VPWGLSHFLAEFVMPLERTDPARRLRQCACYGGLNAWTWPDAERAQWLTDQKVAVAWGSCWDNVCGHCGADFVRADAPILAECYTHVERGQLERDP
jgi:hypothetical protein